jgi:beta-glucanase (GH16 family)
MNSPGYDDGLTRGRRYWEAINLHYWQTGDLEWYDPSAVTTKNGAL